MSKEVQISEHIFAPNGDYNCFFQIFITCTVLKIGEYLRIFSSFRWEIFSHVIHLVHLCVSENI